jgi:foldase protein PrsA
LFPKKLRTGLAFCAAIATAVVLGACGSGVPGNAVATVGGAVITKAALNHWLLVANDATQASSGTAAPPLPDPPNFTKCSAEEKRAAGNGDDTAAQLKALCSQSYQSLLNEVMNYLIQAVWIQGEAYDLHVKVTNAEVNKSYATQRKTSSPSLATQAQLNLFLAKSGQTVADLRWRTYLNLLANALELKVQKKAEIVTSAQEAAYYHSHLSTLTTPATLDVHLIETSTAAAAAKVKSLLEAGGTFAELAPKYSIDPTSKSAGGQLLGVRAGELDTQLSDALFAAKLGVLSGPLKTAFGYYVYEVNSKTPAKVPTLKGATAQIKAILVEQQTTKADATLQKDFTKGWTDRTTCASGYIVSPSCGNAPKSSTSSTSSAAAGATSATG